MIALFIVFAFLFMSKTYSQTDWRELEICPKVLISETDTVIDIEGGSFNDQPLRWIMIRPGSKLTLRSVARESKTLFPRQGEVVGNYYLYSCQYELEPSEYYKLDPFTDETFPATEPYTAIETMLDFAWLDVNDDVNEEECLVFTERFGEPGSESLKNVLELLGRGFADRDTSVVIVSSSNKSAVVYHRYGYSFSDSRFPRSTSPNRFISLSSMKSAALPGIQILENTRAIENSCPQPRNKKVNHDFLLLKDRWPTPGDYIDSILYGQFSDTIPPKSFDHEIFLSLDLLEDKSDSSIFKKSFHPADFKELLPKDHNTLMDTSYLSYDLIQLFVDTAFLECTDAACPDTVNLSAHRNGLYNVLFKTDSDSVIIECDKSNNTYPGMRIEIDDFNPGECDVCPKTIMDKAGNNWTLSEELPDCEDCDLIFPPTAGRAYYDGQSYYASCTYERIGEEPVPLVWIRWHENVLGLDSLFYCNENGEEELYFTFCPVIENLKEEGSSDPAPSTDPLQKAFTGNQVNDPRFEEDLIDDIAFKLGECYYDRAINVDSLCFFQGKIPQLIVDQKILNLDADGVREDTIKIFVANDVDVLLETVEIMGTFNFSIRMEPLLPEKISEGDTILAIVSVNKDQTFEELETGKITFGANRSTIKRSVELKLSKPKVVVDVLYSSFNPNASQDTLYAGESAIIRCRLIDDLSGMPLKSTEELKFRLSSIEDKTTEGLKLLDQEIVIPESNSESVGVQFNPFEDIFGEEVDIDNSTILSGETTIEAVQTNGNTYPDVEIDLVYSFPFDISVVGVEYQQGVVDLDKEIELPFTSLSDKRTFSSLPHIVDHDGHSRIILEVENKSLIPYKSFSYSQISGEITLEKPTSDTTYSVENILILDLNDNKKGIFDNDDYSDDQIYCMQNVFQKAIDRKEVQSPGVYNFKGQIKYKDNNLIINSADRTNDESPETGYEFVRTEELRILAYSGKIKGRGSFPKLELDKLFEFLRQTYPIEYGKLTFENGGTKEFEDFGTPRDTEFKIFNRLKEEFKEFNSKTTKKADVLVVQGDEAFFDYLNPTSSGIGNPQMKIGLFRTSSAEKTVAHEIGHILGLGDTYIKFEDGIPKHYHKNDINPPCKILDFDGCPGNFVDEDNIHIGLKKNILFPSVPRINKEHVLFDFMGNTRVKSDGSIRAAWIDRITYDHLYHTFFKLGAKSRSNGLYVSVAGDITLDNEIVVSDVSKTQNPPYISEEDELGPYMLRFKNESGDNLFSHRFSIDFFITDRGPTNRQNFLFYLPYETNYRSLEITFQDSLIHTFEFSSNSPEIELFTSKYEGDNNSYTFDWSAIDQDNDILKYTLFYETIDGKTWPIEVNLQESNFVWSNLDQPWFDPRNGKFILEVTDGFNEVSESIDVFQITTSTLDETYQYLSATVAPLPVHDKILLSVNSKKSIDLIISLINVHGQSLKSYDVQVKRGVNKLELQTEDLPSGVLFLRLSDASTKTSNVIRVVKATP